MRTLNMLAITLLCGWSFSATAVSPVYDDVPRVIAVGDVHGDYHGLVTLLQRTGMVDPELRWAGGPAHLVMVGDMVDRGDASRRVLDLVMRLEDEAALHGGRVHALLGNHELMWLTGDHEYTSAADYRSFAADEDPQARKSARERYAALTGGEAGFEERFPPGALALRRAMAPGSRYGDWLAARPVVVIVNGVAYTHAGLSGDYAGLQAGTINERVHAELTMLLSSWRRLVAAGVVAPEYRLLDAARGLAQANLELEAGARAAAGRLTAAPDSLLFEPDGPLWYRGYAECNELAESAVLTRALAGLGARSLVVSHTPTASGRIESRLDGRLVLIDTGERPAALEITNGERLAHYADGDAPVPVAGGGVAGVTDLEAFLARAEIVAVEDVGTGVTNPRRVTLERDGVRMRAIFKSEATPARTTGRFSSRRLTNIADRHVYELAAYRLDRLLGLGMVPPAVERRIGRDTGTLQLWVEDAMNERQRRKQGVEPGGACALAKDYALLELFDRLIYNTDRTQENILYRPDWRVALIDHTRAFRTHAGRPETVRQVNLAEAPAFGERLAGLDRAALKAELGELLDDAQISALEARRGEMLAEWRQSLTGSLE